MTAREASTAADRERVIQLLVGAFYADPTWSWVFPDDSRRREQHTSLWSLFVDGAMRYPWVWLDEERAATSVWIPPGGTELSPEQEETLGPLTVDLLGASGAERALRTFDLFDENHPRELPHYYLSLLATDPEQRGRGLGLRLLSDNLAVVDAEGGACYLEASNPANVPLYERFGFRVIGHFDLPDHGPRVHTMWRDPVSGTTS